MKYDFSDLRKAEIDANEQLKLLGSTDELILTQHFSVIRISCINSITEHHEIIHDAMSRDEAYCWLEGFNTALLNK